MCALAVRVGVNVRRVTSRKSVTEGASLSFVLPSNPPESPLPPSPLPPMEEDEEGHVPPPINGEDHEMEDLQNEVAFENEE